MQLAGGPLLFSPIRQLRFDLLRLFGSLFQIGEKLPLQCLSPLHGSERILIAFDNQPPVFRLGHQGRSQLPFLIFRGLFSALGCLELLPEVIDDPRRPLRQSSP